MTETPPEVGNSPVPAQPEVHPIALLTDADLAALLKRAVWVTVVLGGVGSLLLWLGMGWQSAALFAVGAAISAASLLEWGRLIRIFNATLDKGKTPRGTALVVTLFMVRLILFGAVIYGSLKFLQGSPLVLVCGLGLGIVGLTYEALRLLRG